MDPNSFPGILAAVYKIDSELRYDPDQAGCLLALENADMTQLKLLCPRPDRPLTRGDTGLPLAPTQPFDQSSMETCQYLSSLIFRRR